MTEERSVPTVELPVQYNAVDYFVDRHLEAGRGQQIVFTDQSGPWTCAQLSDRVNRTGNVLLELGVEAEQRVLMCMLDSIDFPAVFFGAIKIGAIPVPVNTMLTEDDYQHMLRDSRAKVLVVSDSLYSRFSKVLNNQLYLRHVIIVGQGVDGHSTLSGLLCQASPVLASAPTSADDAAFWLYTSGSTGQPKGVCHPAQSLFTWRYSAHYWLSLTDRDVMWCTADTGWSKAGTSILFGPWSQGSTVFFYDGPLEPKRRFELIEKYKVTVFCAAATELRQLVRESVDEFDLSSLRLTVSAGESVNPEILDAWEALTGVPLLDGYGQTETLMTVLNYPGMSVKPGSMGRALPGIRTAILLESGELEHAGDEGELLIGLPNTQTMLRYWNDPAKTKAALLTSHGETWFKTGDHVVQDEDGYLFYRGRTDDIISSSGYRIGPQEVENALIEHPAVRESAVIGVPDEERGEIVKAFIILNDPDAASPQLVDELQEHTKATTAPYKYPRQIEFVSTLPKTVSGKIQRQLLRKHAALK